MSTASRVATMCVLLVVVAASGPILAVGATGAPTAGGPDDRAASLAPTGPPLSVQQEANNSTVQHENPEDASGDGDLNGLESHLAGVLADRLGQSTVEISEGQYEQGRSMLGDDYSETLGKYVDVAGETDGEGSGDSFESAARNQRSLAESLQEYEETRAEYEEARENGNEQAAREHARDLVELNEEITADGGNVTAAYEDIENGTGVNTEDERLIIEETVENNTETTEAITRDTFDETELTITRRSAPGPVSFADPLRFDGRLTTENGSAVANETVHIEVGERGYTVDTDANGTFTLAYAPVRLPVGERDLTVRFTPGPTTPYLGSDATLPVEVEPTNATLSSEAPNATAFGEELTVRGRLVANGTGVPSAPVRVTLGGRVLGTTTTAADGTYTLTTRVPATVPNGSQPLVASVPLSDRAISASAVESTVTVEETATAIELNASAADRGTVRLAGRLTTADGTPLPNRSVAVRLDGTTVSTLDTDANGSFRAEVGVPESVDPGANVTVVASFGGDGTSLDPASARTVVSLPEQSGLPGGSSGFWEQFGIDSPLGWIVVLLAILVLTGAASVGWRRRDDGSARDDAPTVANEGGIDEAAGTSGTLVLEHARDTLARGEPGAAIELAFGAIRQRLGAELDVAPELTHREFVAACVAAGVGDADALTAASRLYERATFGVGSVSTDAAERALALAQSVLDGDGGGASAGAEPTHPADGAPGGDD